MTNKVAEEIPTTVSDTVSDMVNRLRDAASDLDMDRLRDTASSALPSIDVTASRKALKKRSKKARKSAARKVDDVGATLRERVFGWPLYSVAVAGAVIGSLAWWRNRSTPKPADPIVRSPAR